MEGIIYKATNKINGKSYIGKTINFKRRKYEHKHNSNSYFYKAMKKYGLRNFKWEIIDCALFEEILYKMEKYYIKKLKTKFPNGYNLTDGGETYLINRKKGKYKRCLNCNKKFYVRPSQKRKWKKKYCSLKCYRIAEKIGEYKKCLTCKKEFWINPLLKTSRKQKHKNYCSEKCLRIAIKNIRENPNKITDFFIFMPLH